MMFSSLKYVFSYLFFSLFFLNMITCQENCSSVQCSEAGNEPDIVFPFGIKDLQGVGCGYPGFNLTCNTFDKTVLKLAQSGEFLVRKIDYGKKEIRLYDENNCFARRFQQQNLNVNLSPFKAYAYQIYNFFNCPPSITSSPSVIEIRNKIQPVPCLANPTTTVLVTISSSREIDSDNITKVLISGGCLMVSPATIPIPFDAITKIYSYDVTTDDLHLTWVEPRKPEPKKPEEKKFDWKKILAIVVPTLGAIAAIATIVDVLRKRKQRKLTVKLGRQQHQQQQPYLQNGIYVGP